MLKGAKSLDPCATGNALENVCDLMKNNAKNKGLMMVNWLIIAIAIIIGDILKWFPQIMVLFPDEFTYNIVNLALDVVGVVAFFILLGLPGLISMLKLVDSLIIFVLGAYVPELLPFAFWIEVIPAYSISLIAYYIWKSLTGPNGEERI
jgi:hypothetical protein